MSVRFQDEAFPILKEYLYYLQTIRAKSLKTVDEYFIDLRTFFRFFKQHRRLVGDETNFDAITIDDISLQQLESIRLEDAYEYMNWLQRERGNQAASRARKVSSLRGFFKYVTNKKHYLSVNPVEELETPKKKKALPKYLTLEQSIELLRAVEGEHKERDYAILTLFLNCGIRLSELAGISIPDLDRELRSMRVIGKGSKERIVYLNAACRAAVEAGQYATAKLAEAAGVGMEHYFGLIQTWGYGMALGLIVLLPYYFFGKWRSKGITEQAK